MNAGTLELGQLESLLVGDVECQSQHQHQSNRVCTGEVVARWFAKCRPPLNACAAAASYARRCIAGDGQCGGCSAPTSECWRIEAI